MRILTITFFLMVVCHGLAKSATITLVADQWCPINCEPESEKPGYVIELAQMIFEEAGYDVLYELIPWTRAIRGTQEGQYTAVIGATTDQGNSRLILPEEHFCMLENDYFTKTNATWEYQGPNSLNGKSLGIIEGYAYGDIQSKIESGEIKADEMTGPNPLLLNIKKLKADRFFAIVGWGPIVEKLAKKHGLRKDIRHAGRGGNAIPLYLGFGPGHKDYAALWDKGIKDLKSRGLLEPVLKKYGLTSEICGL